MGNHGKVHIFKEYPPAGCFLPQKWRKREIAKSVTSASGREEIIVPLAAAEDDDDDDDDRITQREDKKSNRFPRHFTYPFDWTE